MKHCNAQSCKRFCVWCVLTVIGLPLEHGIWEWSGAYRVLPHLGLHI